MIAVEIFTGILVIKGCPIYAMVIYIFKYQIVVMSVRTQLSYPCCNRQHRPQTEKEPVVGKERFLQKRFKVLYHLVQYFLNIIQRTMFDLYKDSSYILTDNTY